MFFDKTAVIELVKVQLTSTERKRTKEIEVALGGALDEYALMIRSENHITSYEVSVAINDREKELRGENDDLRNIFAIKIGSGDQQRILFYDPPDQFIQQYDVGETQAGAVRRFTVMHSTEGFPVIRFDVPSQTAETMTVYYHQDMGPENMILAKNLSAIAQGTLAWFFGIADERGQAHNAKFVRLAMLSRAADNVVPEYSVQIRLSKDDQDIRRMMTSRMTGRR